MQTDDTETLRLVQRSFHAGYFACLSLDGSKLLFVWACGPADSIGVCRVTFGNQTPRIWNVTPSESLFILLAAYYDRYHFHYHRCDELTESDKEYLVQLISEPAECRTKHK